MVIKNIWSHWIRLWDVMRRFKSDLPLVRILRWAETGICSTSPGKIQLKFLILINCSSSRLFYRVSNDTRLPAATNYSSIYNIFDDWESIWAAEPSTAKQIVGISWPRPRINLKDCANQFVDMLSPDNATAAHC